MRHNLPLQLLDSFAGAIVRQTVGNFTDARRFQLLMRSMMRSSPIVNESEMPSEQHCAADSGRAQRSGMLEIGTLRVIPRFAGSGRPPKFHKRR
jgi:hypothetical protein